MKVGYTLSHRAKWENPIFRNLLEAGIWAWLCDSAVWQETKIRFNGELITLQRGQIATSIRFIAKGFCISEQVVRTFLDHIKTDGMINTKPTHRATIITICNYDKYQISESPTNTPLTHHQHTTNTNKNEYNNYDDDIGARETKTHGKNDFEVIYNFGCELFPALATRNTSSIQKWLSAGFDPTLDIIPTIKNQKGRRAGSWNYFDQMIADAHATRLKPLPKGNAHENTSRNFTASNKPSKSDEFKRRLIESTLAEIEGIDRSEENIS